MDMGLRVRRCVEMSIELALFRSGHMNDVEHAFHVMLICSSRATNMDPTSSLTEDLSHLSVSDGNAPHEAAFPDTSPQLTRVSRERDVFIDDDHKIYDAEIMNTFSLYRKHDKSLICLHFFLTPLLETKGS
jgi:hypothetical protein